MESPLNFDEVLFTIGPYQVSKFIGRGGMGEVFLAYDPRCGRRVALKRIREDLEVNERLRSHFLYEAHLTGLMSHPSIVPIYDIVDEPGLTYYTMPFIEGSTLSELISLGQKQEVELQTPDPLTTLPVLLSAFLNICRAVLYAHSKGVIHRDLKPSNIMICPNGEVFILDWGLAKIIKDQNLNNVEEKSEEQQQEIDKVTGTVTYVAPEQVFGQKANYRTEIYSLGLILYEILTLRLPFQRDNLGQYRYNLTSEVLLDPARVSPQRNISPILSKIVLTCLSNNPEERYPSIESLLFDLENFLENHFHWFKVDEFQDSKADFWDKLATDSHVINLINLQKRLLLISKQSYEDVMKVRVKVKLNQLSSGIGIFLGVPNSETWEQNLTGYGIWIGNQSVKISKFYHLPHTEINLENTFILCDEWHDILIEKNDTTFNVYFNQKLQLTFVQPIPLQGKHVGLCIPDNETEISDFQIFIGGHAFSPNSLAAPNALFAYHHLEEALNEYRQFAIKQPLTLEGRKAQFRAGVVLLELYHQNTQKNEDLINTCLLEFKKLNHPSSAPLAHIGQALIDRSRQAYTEEVDCFETAFKHYSHHPLSYLWHHQLLSRLLEISPLSVFIRYRYLFLAAKYLSEDQLTPYVLNMLNSQKKLTEPLYFLNDERAAGWPISLWRISKCIRLAFWLSEPELLVEIIKDQLKAPSQQLYSIVNSLFALLELENYHLVEQMLDSVYEVMLTVPAMVNFDWIHEALLIHQRQEADLSSSLKALLPRNLNKQSSRILIYIFLEALSRQQTKIVYDNLSWIEKNCIFSEELNQTLICMRCFAYLLDRKWQEAETCLLKLDKVFKSETFLLSPLFLKGCLIGVTKGQKFSNQYFSTLLSTNSWVDSHLFEKFILENLDIPGEFFQSFEWEKKQFLKQKKLYNHCLNI